MTRTLCSAGALALSIALAATSAQAKQPKNRPGTPPAGGNSGQGQGQGPATACPASAQVNTQAEADRGCRGSFVPGSMAAEWEPATEAEFHAQNTASQAAANTKTGKTFPAPTKASYVPGPGNGGVRCPKYYKFKGSNRPHNLFRVYGSPGKARKEGAWWTFQDTAWKGAAKATYQKKYAICGAWNDFVAHVSCKLKTGAVVAAGPGQSVAKHKDSKGACSNVCGKTAKDLNEKYPTDAAVQVALYNPAEFCDFGP